MFLFPVPPRRHRLARQSLIQTPPRTSSTAGYSSHLLAAAEHDRGCRRPQHCPACLLSSYVTSPWLAGHVPSDATVTPRTGAIRAIRDYRAIFRVSPSLDHPVLPPRRIRRHPLHASGSLSDRGAPAPSDPANKGMFLIFFAHLVKFIF